MIFTIKKNSKLPILKMKIFKDGRNFQDVSTFMNLLEEQNVITFSMKNVDNNQYKIVNKQGVLLLKTPATKIVLLNIILVINSMKKKQIQLVYIKVNLK